MRKRKRNGQKDAIKARTRIMKFARARGTITNEQAKRIGNIDQPWYHLYRLAEAGYLKHKGYNNWVVVKSRGRPTSIYV
jgi:hypothetical protein